METIYVVMGETTFSEIEPVRAFKTRQQAEDWIEHTAILDRYETIWIDCINLQN